MTCARKPEKILGRRGFSLLELIMVLAVLGIMAGLVAPATGRFLDKLSFRKQTAALVAGTRYARLMAVGKGRPVAMRFDGQTHLLSFRGAVEETKEIKLSGDVELELRPETLVFYPDGLATPGRMLARSGSRSQEFRIDPLTGMPVRQ
ncbi:MAG: GspH/FimT family pseudopilin [Desulfobulbia bacterium]